MAKRTYIRITYPSITLGEVAELEEKIEPILDEYGEHETEITSISTLPPPAMPVPEEE